MTEHTLDSQTDAEHGGYSEQLLVVVNPMSASGRTGKQWTSIQSRFAALGVEPHYRVTRAPRHAAEIARRFVSEGGSDIVVVGGDGTLNEVVDGVLSADRPAGPVTLGIVHRGTGGDFARGIGMPKQLDQDLEIAVRGRTRTVDAVEATLDDGMGHRTVRHYLGCANVGMGAAVVRRATGWLKRLGGSAAFTAATVGSLATYRALTVTIEVEGDTFSAPVTDVMIANNRFVGGGMIVAPPAQIDDGLLDLVIVGSTSKARLIAKVPKLYRGTLLEDPVVRWMQTDTLTVSSDQPVDVVLDGELAGVTPLTCRVLPGALQVRVPD